ncbi:MAG: preprotein translocase subunit SecE [Bacilli bacterium]
MVKAKKETKIFGKIKNFIIGVKKETLKIKWTSKKELIKYSLATFAFMVFFCLFFIGTDLIIALISYVKELIG